MQVWIAVATIVGVVVGFLLRYLTTGRESAVLRKQLSEAQQMANERAGFESLAEDRRKTIEQLQRQAAEQEVQSLESAGELAGVRQQLKNSQEKYAEMKADLDTAFKGAAAAALSANNETFLVLAKQKLDGQVSEAKNALGEKETAIKGMLDPLSAALNSLDTQTRAMEEKRAGAYAEVTTLVSSIQQKIPESLDALKNETSQLISALKAPKTRGNWGELQLKRCVEAAGMVDHVSFSEQVSTTTEENARLQPDMTIHLPNGRTVIVDAKTPSDLFSESANVDPSIWRVRLIAHAASVKEHLKSLSGKAYWKQFEHTPEFVVCFLPTEALFSAALEGDPNLIEFGAEKSVVLATPTTLIALLKAVAYGWHQSKITENAKAIQKTGEDLYSKLIKAHEYFDRMGKALQNAVGHYNNFVGAVEGRGGAFFQARRLGSFVHDGQELEIAEPLAIEKRVLTSDDWSSSLAPIANEPPTQD